jgi:hypothetical protein
MRRLAIIVGHSEAAKGAWSLSLQMHEYTLWSEVAIDIWREAKEIGLDCQVFKRDGISIEEVGRRVSEWADLSIELHFNSAAKTVGNTTVVDIGPSGCETLYMEPYRDFAQMIQTATIQALTESNPNYDPNRPDSSPFSKPKDRGLKLIKEGDRGHRNLKAVTCPAVLVEPFFGSNAADSKRFKRNRARFVRALALTAFTFRM